VYPVRGPFGKAHAPQHFHSIGIFYPEQRRKKVQVLLGAHVQVEVLFLETHADPRLYLGVVRRDVLSQDSGQAAFGRQLAREHLDGRGFAGTVRPQESQDLAGRHVKTDSLDRVEFTVTECDVLNLDSRFGHYAYSVPRS
jgi:hypothetical protein